MLVNWILASQNQASSQVNGNQENQVQPTLELNTHDIMLKWEHQQKSSFFKANKKIYPMFPYVEEKMKVRHQLISVMIA